jgi:hypothetical protein
MHRAKIFTAITFLLAFASCISAQKSKVKQIQLSARDKKEIVKQVFDDGFEKLLNSSGFTQCLTPIVNDKKVVFIKSDIDKSLLPNNVEAYRLMIMSHSQIDAEVKKNNGECYLTLSEFQTAALKIRVSLTRTIDKIYRFENSTKYTRWISGKSYIYEFEKADKWKIISSKKAIISS